MKKTLLALAVASVAAAPMAASAASHAGGPTWYGQLRVQLVSQTGDLDIGDGASRWGVKGAHDLGNGLSAIYRMEYGITAATQKTNFSQRLAYVGLSGGFGAVVLGSQWTPSYNAVVSAHDPFAGGGANFVTYGGRANKALAYALPGGMPVSGAIALVIDGSSDEEDDVDAVNAGFNLGAGPVTLGLGYHKDATAERIVQVSAVAKLGGGSIGVLLEDNDNTGASPYLITGKFGGFALQYGDDDADDTSVTVGYTHKLGKQAKMQFTVQDKDSDADTKIVARLRVDF